MFCDTSRKNENLNGIRWWTELKGGDGKGQGLEKPGHGNVRQEEHGQRLITKEQSGGDVVQGRGRGNLVLVDCVGAEGLGKRV